MPPIVPMAAPPVSALRITGAAEGTAPPRASEAAPEQAEQASAERAEIKRAAQAFEAIMLRQLFASARATDFGGEDVMGGQGMEQFTAMRDEHLADIASQTGAFGLAASIETQLAAMKGMR
ncbi:rod-binding protein [Croceicoccus hydrothermalis]|uniref:rod-binding protein n=1 Tax=Croceicoccus hydrothermalis TaxID=2867964 RepID=UPI001EFC1728|nr:rod-binding protein [Croceicoccus hydrothermalis]